MSAKGILKKIEFDDGMFTGKIPVKILKKNRHLDKMRKFTEI